MGPKNQRTPRRSETVPTYDDARNCVRNDTQTMDQTSDLPRNQNEAEEAHVTIILKEKLNHLRHHHPQ
jgi:hypothetical protein